MHRRPPVQQARGCSGLGLCREAARQTASSPAASLAASVGVVLPQRPSDKGQAATGKQPCGKQPGAFAASCPCAHHGGSNILPALAGTRGPSLRALALDLCGRGDEARSIAIGVGTSSAAAADDCGGGSVAGSRNALTTNFNYKVFTLYGVTQFDKRSHRREHGRTSRTVMRVAWRLRGGARAGVGGEVTVNQALAEIKQKLELDASLLEGKAILRAARQTLGMDPTGIRLRPDLAKVLAKMGSKSTLRARKRLLEPEPGIMIQHSHTTRTLCVARRLPAVGGTVSAAEPEPEGGACKGVLPAGIYFALPTHASSMHRRASAMWRAQHAASFFPLPDRRSCT